MNQTQLLTAGPRLVQPTKDYFLTGNSRFLARMDKPPVLVHNSFRYEVSFSKMFGDVCCNECCAAIPKVGSAEP